MKQRDSSSAEKALPWWRVVVHVQKEARVQERVFLWIGKDLQEIEARLTATMSGEGIYNYRYHISKETDLRGMLPVPVSNGVVAGDPPPPAPKFREWVKENLSSFEVEDYVEIPILPLKETVDAATS